MNAPFPSSRRDAHRRQRRHAQCARRAGPLALGDVYGPCVYSFTAPSPIHNIAWITRPARARRRYRPRRRRRLPMRAPRFRRVRSTSPARLTALEARCHEHGRTNHPPRQRTGAPPRARPLRDRRDQAGGAGLVLPSTELSASLSRVGRVPEGIGSRLSASAFSRRSDSLFRNRTSGSLTGFMKSRERRSAGCSSSSTRVCLRSRCVRRSVTHATVNGRAFTRSLSSRGGRDSMTSEWSLRRSGPIPTAWSKAVPGAGHPGSARRIVREPTTQRA